MTSSPHPGARVYVAIFGWLMGLTVLEVSTVLAGWPKAAIVILLVGTALAKAMLIALYFMHLKFDRKLVWLLPGIPVALAIFFLVMLFPDLVWHLPLRY